jgi:translation initiation factor IF-3
MSKEPKRLARVNQQITAPRIRVVTEQEQLGVLTLQEALSKADELGLDLVEIAPQADPPVCKIMDYGKYRYEQTKKEHEAKKKQSKIVVKEVKFRPKTEEHDISYRAKQILGFLSERCKVKITVMFRGREMSHPEQATRLINQVLETVGEKAVVEQPSKMEGRNMTVVLAPRIG